jgi:stearoyl-CoA desaturase (delta-9 desaturase)
MTYSRNIASLPVGVTLTNTLFTKKRLENLILIGVPLLGSVLCLWWFASHPLGILEFSAFIIGYAVIGFGIGIGFHRYFSHKGFKAPLWMQFFLGAAGTMACQGSVMRWVADHRRHHAHSDTKGDTHSPYISAHGEKIKSWRGLLHAHIGWMFDDSHTDYSIYGKNLLNDPVVRFFHKTHWFWVGASLFLPFLYGYVLGGMEHAIGCLLFGGCLRITLFQNAVWAVNSFGHRWGYQNYATGEESKNNKILALLTFGDGWHNNHHQFPRSAMHGLMPKEYDLNGKIITFLEKKRVIKNVIRIPQNAIEGEAVKERLSVGEQAQAA